MVRLVVIQGSLSSDSRTSIVIQEAVKTLEEKGIEHSVIDLRNLELEFCDGRTIENYNQQIQDAYHMVEQADGYIIGMPVYQYTIAGPLKNFLDLVNNAMKYKAVGLIVNSGGIRSYLAGADMLKIFAYELWTVVVQPTIHTFTKDFQEGKLINEKAIEKMPLMIENLLRYSKVDVAR